MSDAGEINLDENIPENSEAGADSQDENNPDAANNDNPEEKKRSRWWKYYNLITTDDGTFANCKFCHV